MADNSFLAEYYVAAGFEERGEIDAPFPAPVGTLRLRRYEKGVGIVANLRFCTRCGTAVDPYAPSETSLRDAMEYGSTPEGLQAEPHYWCSFCGEHWLATNLMDTGAPCEACNTFMPLAAKFCGGCGAALRK